VAKMCYKAMVEVMVTKNYPAPELYIAIVQGLQVNRFLLWKSN